VIGNCFIWAEQVKHKEKDISTLSYIFLKERMKDSGNKVPATEDTCAPYVTADININMPQYLEPTVIPYQENQSTNLLLWNDNFCPIFLFGIDNYLEDDAKNIIYSLFRMTLFIKHCSLENRKAQNIL